MAKQNKVLKQQHVNSPNGRGVSYEQHESIDDSLLPDAIELQKLHEIDPSIIDWIKERTAKEQDARIEFNQSKINLIKDNTNKSFRIDRLSMWGAIIVLLAGMGFSAFLVYYDKAVAGTIFGGVIILYAANAFLNFRKNIQKD